jgi:uncharacterized protein YllA (UPF0747 family)
MAELLAPFGIVCFDPTRTSARRAMAPLLLRAAAAAVPIDQQLAAHSAKLTAAGRDPEVSVGDGAALVMLEGRAGRDRLVVRDGGFVTRRGEERISGAELQAIAAAEPERLSPNVLLRPVVEAAILPTVAYVAGPGELRYLALTAPVYAALEVVPQLPVPRWSGIVVEPFVDRTLEKFGATLDELVRDGAALEAKVARRHFPGEIADALAAVRTAVEAGYGVLERGAGAIDSTLIRTMQGLRERSLFAAEQAERKLIRGLKRRETTEIAQVTRARTAVRPGGQPQERVLTAAVWVARYGPGFLSELAAQIEGWYRSALEASPGGR